MERVELVYIEPQHVGILRNLLQLYLYDFSPYFCSERDGYTNERGLFEVGFDVERYAAPPQPGKPRYWGYLARVEGRWAGFALISDRVDRAYHTGPGHNMDEFFVLRCFRRRGIGRAMAKQVFDRHQGYWQITAIEPNKPAQAFWRAVVRAYTAGRCREFSTEEDGERLVWQVFEADSR